MAVPFALERGYLRLMDALSARWHHPTPPIGVLERCKLISHRGEHDNRRVLENSYAAFDQAAAAGMWGIEYDLRWTRDLVPVVAHDADLTRLYSDHRRIDQLRYAELRARFDTVASLAGVVARYGRRLHLMIEIKTTRWPDPISQNQTLEKILTSLRPGHDYHFMTLTPQSPPPITFVSDQVLVAIANHWADPLCRRADTTAWAGVCGHYSMMRNSLVRRLKQHGKQVGTGYVDSKNCLFRELNRGIDWIFSNNAVQMQTLIDRLIR